MAPNPDYPPASAAVDEKIVALLKARFAALKKADAWLSARRRAEDGYDSSQTVEEFRLMAGDITTNWLLHADRDGKIPLPLLLDRSRLGEELFNYPFRIKFYTDRIEAAKRMTPKTVRADKLDGWRVPRFRSWPRYRAWMKDQIKANLDNGGLRPFF